MAESMSTDAPPSGNRTILVICSYLWILALVPLLVEKSDREVQWHARHGIVLLVAESVFWVLFNIVFGVTVGMGCLGCAIGPAVGLVFVATHIVAMVLGIKGRRLTLPFLSAFADKF
jgi:uncharacterized membrane protein